jgi:surfactin synthase thioesterase subunit
MIFEDGAIVLHRKPEARLRMFVFHHAGGSAMSLLPFVRAVPEDAEIRLFELPGRGLREGEPAADSFEAALGEFLETTMALLNRPAILFGHSLGGMFADSVAHCLPEAARAWLRRVIVSACSHRQIAAAPGPARRRNDADLIHELTLHGGTPPDVFESPQMLSAALRALSDDLRLCDSFTRQPMNVQFPVPYEIWFGDQDREIEPEEPATWLAPHRGPVELRCFRGGHFYLLDRRSQAAETLCDIVTTELEAVR